MLNELTTRQAEVLGMRCRGLLLKEIAAEFGVTVSSINASQREAWRKLGVDNGVDAERKFKRLRADERRRAEAR